MVSVTYTTAPALTDVEVEDLSQTFLASVETLREAAVGSVAIVRPRRSIPSPDGGGRWEINASA